MTPFNDLFPGLPADAAPADRLEIMKARCRAEHERRQQGCWTYHLVRHQAMVRALRKLEQEMSQCSAPLHSTLSLPA